MTKRSREDQHWSLVFEDTSGIRGIVDAAAAVMQRVSFAVERRGDVFVLTFDGADAGMTCVVSARLLVDSAVVGDEHGNGDFTFCVDCKQLQTAMDISSASNASLVVEGYQNDVLIRMCDPDESSNSHSILPIFVDTAPGPKIDDLQFDINIEIDVYKLRDMLKKARKSHAEHMRIQVLLIDHVSRQHSCVTFAVDGDAYHCQQFIHETQQDEDGSIITRAAASGDAVKLPDSTVLEDATPQFSNIFPVDKIEAFVKILPCKMVTAQVRQDRPLMMTHRLGGGLLNKGDNVSAIRFLIAPITE